MKKIFLLLLMVLGFAQLTPAVASAAKNDGQTPGESSMALQGDRAFSMNNMTTEEFLNLTPKKIKAATGKKLKLKEVLALKMAQKAMKKQVKSSAKGGAAGIEKGVYIILAILIPFLAVGLATDWQGNDWLIALLLTLLFWIPGIIYAFIKMGDYY